MAFFPRNSAGRYRHQQHPLLTTLPLSRAILKVFTSRCRAPCEAEGDPRSSCCLQTGPAAAQSLPRDLLDDISSSAPRGFTQRNAAVPEASTEPCPADAAAHTSSSAQPGTRCRRRWVCAGSGCPPRSERSLGKAREVTAGGMLPLESRSLLCVPAFPLLRRGNNELGGRAAEVCLRKDLGWALL